MLEPLGLTNAALATDAIIEKKIDWSGTRTLVFSNEYVNDIIKRIKYLTESGFLIEAINEKVKNEVKEQQ